MEKEAEQEERKGKETARNRGRQQRLEFWEVVQEREQAAYGKEQRKEREEKEDLRRRKRFGEDGAIDFLIFQVVRNLRMVSAASGNIQQQSDVPC